MVMPDDGYTGQFVGVRVQKNHKEQAVFKAVEGKVVDRRQAFTFLGRGDLDLSVADLLVHHRGLRHEFLVHQEYQGATKRANTSAGRVICQKFMPDARMAVISLWR